MAELRSKVMSGGYGKAPQEDYSRANHSRENISSSESSDTETDEEGFEELEEKTSHGEITNHHYRDLQQL